MRRPSEDGYLHKGLRRTLIDSIRSRGVTDDAVLEAMMEVPRHFFLDSAFDRVAYEDRAFPIEAGQTISQPYTVAYQTQLLRLRPYMRVLEIGTGSAYQACVLGAMKVQVFTIERQRSLYDANRSFPYLNCFSNIRLFYGDGYKGLPAFAPFDRILVTAAAPEIPLKLVEQLKPGGLLVIPVNEGEEGGQRMMRVAKDASGALVEESFERFSFVPMLEGRGE
jgi:protein-L-isoaspartate(D-aspartate) O-methyltransferase